MQNRFLVSVVLGASLFFRSTNTAASEYDMVVYPTHVESSDGQSLAGSSDSPLDYPLVTALEHTGYGSGLWGRKILVKAGQYDWFGFDATELWSKRTVKKFSSSKEDPVEVTGEDGVVIVGNPEWGTTMNISGSPDHPFHHVHWRNIKWIASQTAAIFFGFPNDPKIGVDYRGWKFFDCEIDGNFNHLTGEGTKSKWGVFTWSIGEGFEWNGGSIHDIALEHAFYMHNNSGTVTIRNAHLYHLGRTALQVTARIDDSGATDLPPNYGDINFISNIVADTGLADGGQAVTIVGRNLGVTRVQKNIFAMGHDVFQKGIRDKFKPGQGSFVSWTTSKENYETSLALHMTDNYFLYHEEVGNVEVAGIHAMEIAYVKNNYVLNGFNKKAMIFGQENDLAHPAPNHICLVGNEFVNGQVWHEETEIFEQPAWKKFAKCQ